MPSPAEPPALSLSDTLIQAAVSSAIALKQSPIPDLISGMFRSGFRVARSMDETYQLKDKLMGLGKASVAKAIEVDRTYQLHQKLGGAVLTGLSALTQATLAYRNTQGYAPAYPAASGPASAPLRPQHPECTEYPMGPPRAAVAAYGRAPQGYPHGGNRSAFLEYAT
jgi:hypothetical protein